MRVLFKKQNKYEEKDPVNAGGVFFFLQATCMQNLITFDINNKKMNAHFLYLRRWASFPKYAFETMIYQ